MSDHRIETIEKLAREILFHPGNAMETRIADTFHGKIKKLITEVSTETDITEPFFQETCEALDNLIPEDEIFARAQVKEALATLFECGMSMARVGTQAAHSSSKTSSSSDGLPDFSLN